MSAPQGILVFSLEKRANRAFAGTPLIAGTALSAFLKTYGKGTFTGVMARPSGADITLTAGFAESLNGRDKRIELTASDIGLLLEELKKPAHKVGTGNGQTVTRYPALVLALKQAEKDLDLYARPEMTAYLQSRKQDGASQAANRFTVVK